MFKKSCNCLSVCVRLSIYTLSELNCVYNFSIDVAAFMRMLLYDYSEKAGPLIRFNFENVWITKKNGSNEHAASKCKMSSNRGAAHLSDSRRHLSYY